MTNTFIGSSDRFVNPGYELRGIRRPLQLGLNDRKFVASQPGNEIRLPEAAAQPISHRFQQFITDRVPESVVDTLELIDVDVEHRQLLAALNPLQRLFELLTKQRAVWQVGQRIIVRQMRDPLVGPPAFRDVLHRGNPSTSYQRSVHDLNRTSVQAL